MQFLVHAQGNTLDMCNKAYVIEAHSEKEANEVASTAFKSEFGVFEESIITQTFKRTRKSIVAYIFMLVPIILSFINWTKPTGSDICSIAPDLVSCLYSVALYAAFIVRFKGIHRTVGSWIDIIFSILMILLLSSFIQIILVKKTINLFWITQLTVDSAVILPIAIILSWLGLKLVSVVCMASVGMFALFNITTLSAAMGMGWGPLYVISSFMGIMVYLSVEPVMFETVSSLRKSIIQSIDYTKNDLIKAKSSVKSLNVFSQKENAELMNELNEEKLNK